MLSHFRLVFGLLDHGERRRLLRIALLVVLNSGLEVVGVAFVLPFIALVNDAGAIHRNAFLEQIYIATGMSDASGFLVLCGLAFVVLIVLKNGLYLVGVDQQNRFVMGQAGQGAARILGRIIRQPLLELRNVNSAEHQTTFNHSVDNLYGGVILSYLGAATEAIVISGIVAVLVVVEPIVTMVVGLVLGGAIGLLYWRLHRWFGRFGRINNELYAARLGAIHHIFDTLKEIKILGCEDFFVGNYAELRRTNADWQRRAANLQQLPRVVIETLVVAGIVALVLAALFMGGDRQSVTATLGLFAVAAFRIMPSVTRLMQALGNIRQGEDSSRRVADSFRVSCPAGNDQAAPPLAFERAIEVDGLGFSYGESGFSLRDVSLTIRRGETIGLIGPTGSGKSTLMDMLLGLVRPDSGDILVDGTSIADKLGAWRANIGYVPQTIALIDDTVRRNVAFGLADDDIDDARVWAALALAQVDDVIRNLGQGLDSRLGEDGMVLSGGQRQRIGLARALYRDPPLLCMDEATSALDAETEHRITEALATLHGRKTMIVIAHRLSTLKNCDRLVMMQAGRIQAVGTFAQLSETQADFRRALDLASLSTSPNPGV